MKALFLPIVEEGWALTVQLDPGAHLVVMTDKDTLSIEGRRAGLELRDTLAVVSSEAFRYAVLFRKPLVESGILAQLQVTETGSLNIDGMRVGGGENRTLWNYASVGPQGCVNRPGETSQAGCEIEARVTVQGRWPTNVVFVHTHECRRTGPRKIKGNPTSKTFHDAYEGDSNTGFLRGWSHSGNQHSDEDGLETVEAWECTQDCLVPFLDVQSGVRPATLTGRADPEVAHSNPGDNNGASWFGGGNSNVYADSGGASRYYPQFADDAELFDWITRLITVPA